MSFGGDKGGKPIGLFGQWFLGSASSMTAVTFTTPIDLIKVRLQLQGEGAAAGARAGVLQTGFNIIKQDGFLGLYSGLTASYARQVFYSGSRIAMYPYVRSWLQGSSKDPSVLSKFGAGLIAGGIGAAIANPCDVVLVRMQADSRLPPESRRNYANIFDGIVRIVREEGVLALGKGIGPTVVRASVTTLAQLGVYDVVKDVMVTRAGFEEGLSLHFWGSMIAGLMATSLNSPFDVIKTRVMNSKGQYTGPIDCFKKTLVQEGPLAFYKGFIPNWARLGPQTVITLMVLEQLTRLWKMYV